VHPAASIIVFTTLSGMGFGLVAALGLGLLAPGGGAVFWGSALAVALTGAGLSASLLHLGHPERAWRALSQWRSSWLSREGVLSLATLVIFAAYAGARVFLDAAIWPLGWLAALLAALTVYATAMIYASLRTVAMWNRALTPACYLGFAAAGGTLLLALLAQIFGQRSAGAEVAALLLLLAAWGLKLAWWRGAEATGYAGSTPESATGLGHIGRVRLFEAPHTSPNYLMREMVHVVGRRHAAKLRALALGLGAAVPGAALVLSLALDGSALLLLAGAIAHLAGLMAERWLFFAEARHTVALYYGHGGSGHPGIARGAIAQTGDQTGDRSAFGRAVSAADPPGSGPPPSRRS
jgi:DMSO reductase anchor subunit